MIIRKQERFRKDAFVASNNLKVYVWWHPERQVYRLGSGFLEEPGIGPADGKDCYLTKRGGGCLQGKYRGSVGAIACGPVTTVAARFLFTTWFLMIPRAAIRSGVGRGPCINF